MRAGVASAYHPSMRRAAVAAVVVAVVVVAVVVGNTAAVADHLKRTDCEQTYVNGIPSITTPGHALPMECKHSVEHNFFKSHFQRNTIRGENFSRGVLFEG